MSHRINYQPIVLALTATLLVAGLFYLPYLAVRSKTIENFHNQQVILARQASTEFQGYFSTYEKALMYLSQQPSIQQLDESGKGLLREFYSFHPEDLNSILYLDPSDQPLFVHPAQTSAENTTGLCSGMHHQSFVEIGELDRTSNGPPHLALMAPMVKGKSFFGCLAFPFPYQKIAEQALGQIIVHQHGYVLLFSQTGSILHGPNPGLLGKQSEDLHGEEDELQLLSRAIDKGTNQLLKLSSSLLPQSKSIGPMYAVLYPVRLSHGKSWSILLVTPEKEVLGAMAEFRSQWLLVTSVAVVAVGLLSFFLCGIVDVRKQEQERRAMEEKLAKLLDLVPMGVVVLDAQQNMIYANLEATRLLGQEEQRALIDHPLGDYLHPDCRTAVLAQILSPLPDERICIEHATLCTAQGKEYDISLTAAASTISAHPQCIVLLRDITEELRALAWQRRLAMAVDQVKEAVLIAAADGSIEYVNISVGEMTGYSRGECMGNPVSMLWAKEQDAHFEQKMEDVVALGEVWSGRIVNQRKNSSLFVAAATISPVRDAQGTITHIVLVQRDITHEVEIDTRMRQAQKMEAIGTLAGGIAHDFNNILGGIIGFTDMTLLQTEPGSDLHSNLMHIRQGGKRAADLVQQILTFSRQSAEELSPIILAPIIQESLSLMRATLPATIEIIQNIEAEKAKVVAAPVQIQQIVMNLCANAFYAMKDTGGKLTIRLYEQSGKQLDKTENQDKTWAILVVKDTGQGMENETLQRIFTPFFTTKQPGEGTGMGLSVVHGIVRELGGEITVQSEPDRGTVFTVQLPIVAHNGNGNLLASETALPHGKEHILVVDDEQEIRETCRMMLGHLGYTITTTAHPLEVLDLIAASEPPVDLVITDQTMPKMTGLDLTEQIRNQHPKIPVILCTGYSDRLNYDIAREAGACDLLMKPVDLHGLSVAVRVALEMTLKMDT
ncbi:PAS domain S-box protein [Desulfobulbus rhabdoformis]|uniref:PAS domain-containing protein n=1 Tax=Desulfobulbus rhabdoformis TaxID=34032 RepID=UPI001962E16E|nr:PAS domain-containing protein [Desulfobulbus rhabdoformis]MBM9613459.1 PAS domain S-box protein [Desulfobulbus rhabdoformis]